MSKKNENLWDGAERAQELADIDIKPIAASPMGERPGATIDLGKKPRSSRQDATIITRIREAERTMYAIEVRERLERIGDAEREEEAPTF